MLPSMPILFPRDSQDAFGNKTNPSSSFFVQNSTPKTFIIPEPPLENVQIPPPVAKEKINAKKKERLPVDPPKTDENALELALVRTFYTKVQSRFASNQAVPTNKFVQFHNILKTFDPSKETPVDLYRKIEQLFGDKHKDLVEEFLLFLNPGQAAQVGRFMDHFSYAQMINFISMLQCTFARKPTVLRKILRALTTGLNGGGSSASVRARIMPHLRSSPRLAQLFTSLLPDERPPDTLYQADSDTMNEDMLTNDKGYDVWEFDDEADGKKKLDAKERLDTAYLHGRVFLQHGRILRAASVTYPYSKEPYRVHAHRLTSTHGHVSPPESDDERSSPKRNTKTTSKIPPKRTKKQAKSPTKNVKDVNDNTRNKDCAVNVTNSPRTVKSKTATTKSKSNKHKETDTKTYGILNKKDKKANEKSDESAFKVKPIKIETPVMQVDKPELKGNSWTREEDKTMLQVLKGEARSEQVFGRIKELLPHRSPVEIKERFCHVMNLLQQMAVGEYLHGRVFLQHGRILRAASVTYPYSKEPYRVHAHRLTSTHGHVSPPESDDERSSPKRNTKTTSKIPPKRTKKQAKSPTKNVKDVNDNTRNKDCAVNVTNSPRTVKSKTATTKSKSNKHKETDTKTYGILNKKDKKANEKSDESAFKVKPIKIETPVMQVDKPELKGNSWTREEDKTMLQVLKGEARSEQVFGRIKELLPHRSPVEIKERFCHVMNLLQQMAVGEVT